MGTHYFYGFKDQFAMAKFAPLMDFISRIMCFVSSAFWGFTYSFILYFLPRFFRHGDQEIQENESSNEWSGNQITKDSGPMLLSSSDQISEGGTLSHENGFEAQGVPENEDGESFCSEDVSDNAATASKYQFSCSCSYSGFVEGPQTMSFSVKEMFLDSNDGQCLRNQELSPNFVNHEPSKSLSFDAIIDEENDHSGSVPDQLECCDIYSSVGGDGDSSEQGNTLKNQELSPNFVNHEPPKLLSFDTIIDEDNDHSCSVPAQGDLFPGVGVDGDSEQGNTLRNQELSPNVVVSRESLTLLSFDLITDKEEDHRGSVPQLGVNGNQEQGKAACCSASGESDEVKEESEKQELDNSMQQIVEDGLCKEEEEEKGVQEKTPRKEDEFCYDKAEYSYAVGVKEQGSVKLNEHFFDFLNNYYPEYDSDSDTSLVSQSDEPETPSDTIDHEEEYWEYLDHYYQSRAATGVDGPPSTGPVVDESPIIDVEQEKNLLEEDNHDHELNSAKHQEEPDKGPDAAGESSITSSNNLEEESKSEEKTEPSVMDTINDEDEDDEGQDVLLEHMEYVKQMRKELRKTKISGLPTILEESESLPRMDQGWMKPLKIDDAKVGHKDRMDEIQTFYRSYLDKMRKLDILSNQTMYAIGVLQLKNPDHFSSNKKQSVALKKILANKLRLRHVTDPLHDSMRDLNKDLELVYVGQLCLSWEILRWEHGKAKELELYDDPNGLLLHRYNVTAEDFQQFEVLLQRFIEDEPYQGPRVENYIKNRTANCRFLQVPPIRDDYKHGQAVREKGGGGAVSISRLVEVIEESIHVLWLFLRADKDENSVLPLKIFHRVDLQDPSDSELLAKIRTSVLKKERRLKDLIRSGNCIVNKFQKQQGRDTYKMLSPEMVLAQIELRLVSRVMSMSSLTKDQVQWCHKKISKIKLVGREVQTESSFLLFPC